MLFFVYIFQTFTRTSFLFRDGGFVNYGYRKRSVPFGFSLRLIVTSCLVFVFFMSVQIGTLGAQVKSASPYELTRRGHTLFTSGNYSEALPVLEEAVKLAPRDAWAWSLLGRTRLALQDSQGALGAFRQTLRLSPADPLARVQVESLAIFEAAPPPIVLGIHEDKNREKAWQADLIQPKKALVMLLRDSASEGGEKNEKNRVGNTFIDLASKIVDSIRDKKRLEARIEESKNFQVQIASIRNYSPDLVIFLKLEDRVPALKGSKGESGQRVQEKLQNKGVLDAKAKRSRFTGEVLPTPRNLSPAAKGAPKRIRGRKDGYLGRTPDFDTLNVALRMVAEKNALEKSKITAKHLLERLQDKVRAVEVFAVPLENFVALTIVLPLDVLDSSESSLEKTASFIALILSDLPGLEKSQPADSDMSKVMNGSLINKVNE